MNSQAGDYFNGLSPLHQMVAKHLLFLGVEGQFANRTNFQNVYSGFVAEVEGHWLWITAGHVIQELIDAVRAGATIVAKHFYDIGPVHWSPVDCPYDLTSIVFFDEDGSRDFALLELRVLTVEALKANQVEPISQQSVAPVTVAFDHYCLVGAPSEYQENAEGLVSFAPVMLVLKRLPDDVKADGFRRYRFDVSPSRDSWPDGELQSIVGTSGGPVFGFLTDSAEKTLSYSCIGIQSSWMAEKWESYACPLRVILDAVRASLRSTQGD